MQVKEIFFSNRLVNCWSLISVYVFNRLTVAIYDYYEFSFHALMTEESDSYLSWEAAVVVIGIFTCNVIGSSYLRANTFALRYLIRWIITCSRFGRSSTIAAINNSNGEAKIAAHRRANRREASWWNIREISSKYLCMHIARNHAENKLN